MIVVQNYIAGSFETEIETIDNIGPSTGGKIAKIPRTLDANASISAAKEAKEDWANRTMADRAKWLGKIADAIEQRKSELAKVEALDTGKPIEVALNVDIDRCIKNFRFFSEFKSLLSEDEYRMDDATNFVLRKPMGVVALITPWNLPLYLLTWKLAPALLMGNTVVAKPSELTPLSAHALCQILEDIQFPKGVINMVHGFGHEIGQSIIEHPDIDAISFTGGTQTGRIVAKTAAPMFKKLSLELGGKNSSIILDDADLSIAIPGVVRAGFLNSGQICLCGSRILVHESIYDEFMKEFIPQVNHFSIGPVISESHMQKVLSYIELAKEEGGKILTGGEQSEEDGFYIPPTVITGLDPEARCSTEEIFGPVVTIHTFQSDEEAIAIANNTDYGLAGSVWSKNRGRLVSEKIESGMIWVNTWLHRDLRVPFGGVKDSGLGREGGRWSLDFFSQPVNICVMD